MLADLADVRADSLYTSRCATAGSQHVGHAEHRDCASIHAAIPGLACLADYVSRRHTLGRFVRAEFGKPQACELGDGVESAGLNREGDAWGLRMPNYVAAKDQESTMFSTSFPDQSLFDLR